MTFEQRMAELGVDLSDLPMGYSEQHLWKAYDALFDWNDHCEVLAPFVLHLIDVIDRMETRLVNLTGERDYLLRLYGYDCEECNKYNECNRDGDYCERDLVENWAGVPEDWRAE